MIRNWIKARAADVLCGTHLDQAIGSWSGARQIPLVVAYHRVVEDFAASAETSIPSMLVSQTMLEQHLDWIGRRYRFVDLNELGTRLETGDGINEPVAAVTFDDGYQDFYQHAFPVLQKKGIPAAVFVVSDLVGTKRLQIHDRLFLLLARRFRQRMSRETVRSAFPLPGVDAMTPYEATRALLESLSVIALEQLMQELEGEDPLPEEAYAPFQSLTWEEVDILRRGGITIGSHTKSHVLMTRESGDRLQDELTGSRRDLERRLATNIDHIAYPSGMWDTNSLEAVAAAGYRFGFSGCTHRDARRPSLTIPRVMLWQNACLDSRGAFSEAVLSCQVHRALDLVSGCRQRHESRNVA